MDPLSDVLSLLKPRNYLSAGLEAGGDWAIQFPDQQAAIKCGAVVSGQCWLSVEGVTDAVRLDAGDCFLLPRGRPFRLASDLGLPTVDARTIFSPARTGGLATFPTRVLARVQNFFGGVMPATTYRGAADPNGTKWWAGWTNYARN